VLRDLFFDPHTPFSKRITLSERYRACGSDMFVQHLLVTGKFGDSTEHELVNRFCWHGSRIARFLAVGVLTAIVATFTSANNLLQPNPILSQKI